MPSGPPPASATVACAEATAASSEAASQAPEARAAGTERGQSRPVRKIPPRDRSREHRFAMQSLTLRRKVRGMQAHARGFSAGRLGSEGSAGFEVAQASRAAVIRLGRRARIEQHALELREIAEKPLASFGGDAAERLRASLGGLRDLDEPRVLEHLEVTAQIAVGEATELLDHCERQSFRIGEQRGEHTESRALVHDAVEALVRERMRPLALGFNSLHDGVD